MNFKIGNIRIRLSFLFFAMLTMIFAIDKKGIALITLFSAALHEIGHIVALFLFGSCPDGIKFGIFGIRIQQNKYILSDLKQTLVVVCGPLVNILIFATSLVVYSVSESQIMLTISAVNLVVASFNLIPIFPLDGGRILFAVLSVFLSDGAVRIIMRIICAVLLLMLIFSGVFLVRRTGVNVSLLATGIYLGVLCIKSVKI